MKTFKPLLILTISAVAAFGGVVQESYSSYTFKGALGLAMRMMSDMNKPQKSVEYYSDHASRSDQFDEKGKLVSSSIFDADKGAIISIDHQEKTYTEMTFADMEKMMDSSMQNMEDAQVEETNQEKAEVDVSYKVDIKKLGKETVNGFNADKYAVHLTIEATATGEKDGEAYEAKQPLIVNSTVWAVKNLKAAKQMQEYNKAMAKKMAKNWTDEAEDMSASVSASNPELADAMIAMQKEMSKIDGSVVKKVVSYEKVQGTSTEAKKEKKEIPTSVGGLLGGLSKKVAKSIEKSMESDVLMESTTEIKKLEIQNLQDSVFKIPAGYKKIEMNYGF